MRRRGLKHGPVRRQCRGTRRRGSVVVETAVMAPLLLTMMFGVVEFGWVFMVQENLTNSVREACRVAALKGGTQAQAETRFAESVAPTGLTAATYALSVQYLDRSSPADGITDEAKVSVGVPYSAISLIAKFLYLDAQDGGYAIKEGRYLSEGYTLRASCSMRQER